MAIKSFRLMLRTPKLTTHLWRNDKARAYPPVQDPRPHPTPYGGG
jgi:hypothetical protein